MRAHNPTDEELRQLITIKLLTNKELYDAVEEEIYNYIQKKRPKF
jgi:hypothetical protein